MTIADEIERFLRTGDADPLGGAWPGNVVEAGRRGDADLTDALVHEVLARTVDARVPAVLSGPGLTRFTRTKLAPMVRGLGEAWVRSRLSRGS